MKVALARAYVNEYIVGYGIIKWSGARVEVTISTKTTWACVRVDVPLSDVPTVPMGHQFPTLFGDSTGTYADIPINRQTDGQLDRRTDR